MTKILPAKSSKGFTLIEIMIVLAIMGGLIAAGVSRFRRLDANVKTVARTFTVLAKEVRNQARMKNMTYRLVIQMDEKQGHAYWIEATTGQVFLQTEEQKRAEEDKKVNKDNSDEKAKPAGGFQMDKSVLKDIKKLPLGLYFKQVETQVMDKPQTEGLAYVHFFAEGMTESAVVQITDKDKITWSVAFNALTGRADVADHAVSLKELNAP